MTFYQVVEEVKNLSPEEIEELQILLQKYLIEKRRDEILKSYEESKTEDSRGKLVYHDNIDDLMKELD